MLVTDGRRWRQIHEVCVQITQSDTILDYKAGRQCLEVYQEYAFAKKSHMLVNLDSGWDSVKIESSLG
jgi:hypothetical protein